MTDKIQQARRELFEAWYVTDCRNVAQITITQEEVSTLRGPHGDYRERAALHGKWEGFNAALDCVVIELPEKYIECDTLAESAYDEAVDDCRAAIESTNLGIKVK